MRIAYLINRYPAVSHSFIRREIAALERLGHEVLRLSIRGWNEPVFGDDVAERPRTRYVLQRGLLPLASAFVRLLATRPVLLFRAFALTLKTGWHADRPLRIHFIYLLEACIVFLWLRETGAEHLHAHFGTNPATVAMLVRELGGPPWSFTAHGPEEFDKPALIALPEKIRRATFVVAVSSFGRSQLFRQVTHEYWYKIKVVHCGIDSSYCNDAARQFVGRRLVCVGRLCEQKGQLLLLDATRRLIEQGRKFELVLVGDGEMRAAIQSQIERYRLKDHVRITGWLGGTEVKEEILAARALVLPSFAEGLPVVLMEAMALQRPVISTFVAGIPELVRSGCDGWLVPAGDIEALARSMAVCLGVPVETIRQMGASGRSRVLEQHDVDTEARRLADLFRGKV